MGRDAEAAFGRRQSKAYADGLARPEPEGVEGTCANWPLSTVKLGLKVGITFDVRAQIERNRLLVSWHRDGTARFFDIVCPLL